MNLKTAILLFLLMFLLTSEGKHEFHEIEKIPTVNRTDLKDDLTQMRINRLLNESEKSFQRRMAVRDTTIDLLKTKKIK